MKRSRMKGWARVAVLPNEERGQAVVEFAILAPVLILLLLAMVDFGRVFEAWVVTTNAAREGARYAAIYSTKDYITDAQVVQMSQEKAYEYLVSSGLGSGGDVTYSINDIKVCLGDYNPVLRECVGTPSKLPGGPVVVNALVKVQIWAMLNAFLSNPANIQGQATMRI